jgi:beta-glucanase (GH16 family)
MAAMISVALLAVAGGAAGCQLIGRAEQAPSPWHLVFSDEFGGTQLSERNWTTCYWWQNGGCTNLSSGERSWYLPANVAVGGGALHLTARRPLLGAALRPQHPYTSGMVTTGRSTDGTADPPRFAFQYGRVEARMRMPAGRGLWSAMWLLPLSHQSRPEIDIVEMLGQDPRRLHAHFHYLEGGRRQDPGQSWIGPDASAGWHTYSVDWTPKKLVWSVDGQVKWRFTNASVIPHEPMYLLINLAVGGGWPGNPVASTPFPSTLGVDYVRIWQKDV